MLNTHLSVLAQHCTGEAEHSAGVIQLVSILFWNELSLSRFPTCTGMDLGEQRPLLCSFQYTSVSYELVRAKMIGTLERRAPLS